MSNEQLDKILKSKWREFSGFTCMFEKIENNVISLKTVRIHQEQVGPLLILNFL